MRIFAFLSVCALLVFVDGASRRGKRLRFGNGNQGMMRFKSGRRVAELTIDQNNLRALCESKITPGVSGRRVMETTIGGKGAAFLEGEGIDRKLLCQSKLYEEIKKDGMVGRQETVGTAMISNEDNVEKLLGESSKGPSLDKKLDFSVEADSSVTFNHDKNVPYVQPSVKVEGSAEGLRGYGFKSNTRSFTTLQNRRKMNQRNLMEMDHFKETDFELGVK